MVYLRRPCLEHSQLYPYPISVDFKQCIDTSPLLITSFVLFPALAAAQRQRIQHAYRPGTRSNHRTQLRRYYGFCQEYGLYDLNPSQHQLCLYMEYLAQRFVSARTVRNYMSAITLLHKQLDVSCPALSSFQVGLMARAVDRTMLTPPSPRLPVSVLLLRQLVQATLPLGVWGVVFRFAILLAFFGFLRQSNLAPRTASQFDSARHSRRRDVVFTKQGAFIRLRWTKTLQSAHQPVFVPLPVIDNSPLCPVAAFRDMAASVPVLSSKSPLLLVPSPGGELQVVTIPMLAQTFKDIINSLGLPLHTFSLHSLRRGGATLAFEAGVPVDCIKGHGTWSSQSVYTYICPATNLPSTVPTALAHAVHGAT
jgi:hypothetical protein